jgi:hypothetical protein
MNNSVNGLNEQREQKICEARVNIWKSILTALPEGAIYRLRWFTKEEYTQERLMSEADQLSVYVNGENIGRIELARRGYMISPSAFVIISKRIPARPKWKDEGSRRYKNLDSALKGIRDFFAPTSDLEAAKKEANERYRAARVRVNDRARALTPEDGNKIVSLLASNDLSNQAEGQKRLDRAVRLERQKVRYWRRANKVVDALYYAWVAMPEK